jgi:hypothetical protein
MSDGMTGFAGGAREGEEGGRALERPSHHLNWNRALDDAVEKAARELAPGEEATFAIELAVRIVRTNPGWIDRYEIRLNRET